MWDPLTPLRHLTHTANTIQHCWQFCSCRGLFHRDVTSRIETVLIRELFEFQILAWGHLLCSNRMMGQTTFMFLWNILGNSTAEGDMISLQVFSPTGGTLPARAPDSSCLPTQTPGHSSESSDSGCLPLAWKYWSQLWPWPWGVK